MKFAIDRGGTFTDIYAEYDGTIYVEKLLSVDPANYSDAPREGIRRLLKKVMGIDSPKEAVDTSSVEWIRMGTTVATNALLEHKGAKTALLITEGFKDLLRIGYQNRPELFALEIMQPVMLYGRVVEIAERMIVKNGKFVVEKALDLKSVEVTLKNLRDEGYESVAVVLMHAYGDNTHEKKIKTLAEAVGFEQISLSHEVMDSIKIVERGESCVVDAYLTPHIKRYIKGFRSGFKDNLVGKQVDFMQSFGGLCDDTAFEGINAVLSGPAGGVVGLKSLYKDKALIGFDMGGTSTDVSRYDGRYALSFEHQISGVNLKAPQMEIETVAAGGGSRLFYENEMFMVGPESSGAHPGPVCYKKGGYLSVTDANLVLGRIQPEYFPHIFGKDANEPLGLQESREAFKTLAEKINFSRQKPLSIEAIAYAFIRVANDAMVKPIKEVSSKRGFALNEHILVPFGGAGAQHACAIALMLGIDDIIIHADAGVFCAYGLSQAERITRRQRSVRKPLEEMSEKGLNTLFETLAEGVEHQRTLLLRYERSEQLFMIDDLRHPATAFRETHMREFGFLNNDRIILEEIQAEMIEAAPKLTRSHRKRSESIPKIDSVQAVYFEEGWRETPIYLSKTLQSEDTLEGPAIIMDATSTIVIEPNCRAVVDHYGDIHIQVASEQTHMPSIRSDAQWLPIFANLYASIAEQMGHVLQRTAISTNIKERLDFSCALFDAKGDLIANAPHVPVHLGSMSSMVKVMLKQFNSKIESGDVFISNAPYEGGSHLPDITLISPYVVEGKVRYITASRGHHADIGGITPGSMPPTSKSLEEEGTVIEMQKAVKKGLFQETVLMALFQHGGARKISENLADIKAQIAANYKGVQLLEAADEHYSSEVVIAYMGHIQFVSAKAIRQKLKTIAMKKKEELHAQDSMDDGSIIDLKLTLDAENGTALFDFTDSADQSPFNQNAPLSITYSAVIYALRCLIDEDLPLNGGFLQPVSIKLREGSILNPNRDAAVVGGNVTTSQRIVDVIFQAFGNVADSSGCMNNLTFGTKDFGYYETIGGGSGAGEGFNGASGVHTHMTNTRITDPEILEQRYPVVLEEFSLRKNSGGKGKWHGGDGLIRSIRFKETMEVSILSERRRYAPHGINGGENGAKGENLLFHKGESNGLEGKVTFKAKRGDILVVKTPGGGGYGAVES
ncbi:MAG: 5-oxoprolinase [Epsilonproteobacteria bacterium]|nr:MAG: 5-oxoprolinase [Campylobacterota bacterium]